jgi:hypothetical protein
MSKIKFIQSKIDPPVGQQPKVPTPAQLCQFIRAMVSGCRDPPASSCLPSSLLSPRPSHARPFSLYVGGRARPQRYPAGP